MHKALVVISFLFLLIATQLNDLEYDLINQILKSNQTVSLNEQFFSYKEKFQTYGEFSLAFSNDLLDPRKSFDLDSVFSNQQKKEFDEKLKIEKSTKIDLRKISSSSEGKIFDKKSKFQISYPIIQKGVGDKLYGIIFENFPSFESGGRSVKIYRLDGKKWTLLHESIVSIS